MDVPKKKVVNKKRAKSLLLSTLVASLVAISPYIFYLYESFPKEKQWETFFFTFTSSYTENLYTTAWFIVNKFVPLYLLILWFLTCKDWWYHVLLIPISMFIFQLLSIVNSEIQYIDEFEIYYIIPVMMVVIPLVYWIRIKLFDKYVYGIDLKEIEDELKKYEEQEKHQENTSYLDE